MILEKNSRKFYCDISIYDCLKSIYTMENTKYERNEEFNLHTSKSLADRLLASCVSFYKAMTTL